MFICSICQAEYAVLPDYCDATLACASDMGDSFTDENGVAVVRKAFECVCGEGCDNLAESSDECWDFYAVA